MTHADLVQACLRIAQHEGCDYRVADPSTPWNRGEHPDVFALFARSLGNVWPSLDGDQSFVHQGHSFVLDAKTSMDDLRADRDKYWRKPGEWALGTRRAYVCESYVIEPHQVEDAWGWGLYWIEPDGSHACKKAPPLHKLYVDVNREKLLIARNPMSIAHHQQARQQKAVSIAEDRLAALRDTMEADQSAPWTLGDIRSVLNVKVRADKLADQLKQLPWLACSTEAGKTLFFYRSEAA